MLSIFVKDPLNSDISKQSPFIPNKRKHKSILGNGKVTSFISTIPSSGNKSFDTFCFGSGEKCVKILD